MKTLESMAKETFEKFSIRETGKLLKWKYLSDERKLEWMQELFELMDYYMEELRGQLKPLPINPKSDTVYAAGLNDGIRSERVFLHQLMEKIHKDLADQLVDFQNK